MSMTWRQGEWVNGQERGRRVGWVLLERLGPRSPRGAPGLDYLARLELGFAPCMPIRASHPPTLTTTVWLGSQHFTVTVGVEFLEPGLPGMRGGKGVGAAFDEKAQQGSWRRGLLLVVGAGGSVCAARGAVRALITWEGAALVVGDRRDWEVESRAARGAAWYVDQRSQHTYGVAQLTVPGTRGRDAAHAMGTGAVRGAARRARIGSRAQALQAAKAAAASTHGSLP